jgi:hypothetical protein
MPSPCGAADEASATSSGKSAETAAHTKRLRIYNPLLRKPAFAPSLPQGLRADISDRFEFGFRSMTGRRRIGECAAKWLSAATRRDQRTANGAAFSDRR